MPGNVVPAGAVRKREWIVGRPGLAADDGLCRDNLAAALRPAQRPGVAIQKHLLVDGSNILHAWPELRALLKRDREAARAELSRSVRTLHDVEQWRVTIVFDGRGTDLVVEHPHGESTFSHVYTPAGTTADDVIEQLAGTAATPADVLVATDDRAERQTVEASGAAALSAADLAARVARAQERQRTQVSGLRRENEREWRRPKS